MPAPDDDYYSLLVVSLAFFVLLLVLALGVWSLGELRRRRRRRQLQSDAEYLLHTTTADTAAFAPHQDF